MTNVTNCVKLLVDANVSDKHDAFIFSSEYVGRMFLRIVGIYSLVPTALQQQDRQRQI